MHHTARLTLRLTIRQLQMPFSEVALLNHLVTLSKMGATQPKISDESLRTRIPTWKT